MDNLELMFFVVIFSTMLAAAAWMAIIAPLLLSFYREITINRTQQIGQTR